MNHPATIFFSAAHPLFSMLKAEIVDARPEFLAIRFTGQREFLEHRQSTRLHSGFASLILDTIMGGAVMGSLAKLVPIATVNLAIQHGRRPLLDSEILCTARVENISNQLATVIGELTCCDTNEKLASAVGSFMIGTRAVPLAANNEAGK